MLYQQDPFKCIELFAACILFQVQFNCEWVHFVKFEFCWTYSEINIASWWWASADDDPASMTIVPVICTFDTTLPTKFAGNQHVWLLEYTIGPIGEEILQTALVLAMDPDNQLVVWVQNTQPVQFSYSPILIPNPQALGWWNLYP